MKVIVAGILSAVAALAGCGTRPAVIEITDVTKPQTFVMSPPSTRSVSGLSLHYLGTTDGEVAFLAAEWEPTRFQGSFDARQYYDWFERSCLLEYKPADVSKGKKMVEYQYH